MDAKSRESFSGANVTIEGSPLDLPTILTPGQKLADGNMTIKMAVENSPIAMAKELPGKDGWLLAPQKADNKITITSHRIGSVPGTHSVVYSSDADSITFTHGG